MIQAIQVLRFHLLELEKVIFCRHFLSSAPLQTCGLYLQKRILCESVVISVKINHGAISLPRLITTQAVTTGTDSAKSPRVL